MFELATTLAQGLRDFLPEDDTADGLVTGGEAFREGDEIRAQLKMLGAKPAAKTPKAADDFIENE